MRVHLVMIGFFFTHNIVSHYVCGSMKYNIIIFLQYFSLIILLLIKKNINEDF